MKYRCSQRRCSISNRQLCTAMLLAELPTSNADAQKICLPILERMRSVRSCARPTAVHFIRSRGVVSHVESAVVRQPFVIGGLSVKPGERRLVDLPISKLSNHAPVALPVHVLHGSRPGPTMFVSAAIHGDELNGVEIIRRLLRTLHPRHASLRPRRQRVRLHQPLALSARPA
jgi:hypothetical protein